MFDRVAVAFALVMLLLFSAEVALSCIECDHGTAQCPVSLEHRAEEAIDADLEVVLQSTVTKNDSDGGDLNYETVSDVAVTDTNGGHLETKAVGAAGVRHGVVTNDNDGYNDIIGRYLGSGRFAGAPA